VKENNVDKLIRDLFALYSKYGRSAFENAINELQSGRTIERLLHATSATRDALARVSARPRNLHTSNKTRKTPKERLEEFLNNVSKAGTEDAVIIARFVSDIAERRALRTVPSLRQFSERIGITQNSNIDRRILAMKIGERLLEVPPEQRQAYLATGVQSGRESSSLRQWSKIIVKDGT
jgi:hypothetical protein